MPVGRAPDSTMLVTVGVPVVVIVKLLALFGKKVVLAALVMAGASFTVMVKDCVALGVTPFAAVIVIGKVPPTVGVPEIVAVPVPLFTKLTPAGSDPVSLIVIDAPVGKPVVVTVNVVPATFFWKVAELALVIAGAWFTVSVNDCVASGVMPFAAVIVIG